METEKQKMDRDHMLEILVVIMLGITALLTAWASWIGGLHGGNQATNYTVSNNLAAEGNSEYNAGVQSMMQDMLLWNEISDLQIDILFAQSNDNEDALENSTNKLYFKLFDNLSEEMAEAIAWDFEDANEDITNSVLKWMEKGEALESPFANEAFFEKYFVDANALLEESAEVLEQGKKDNSNGDAFGLVTVLYSVVLFMLGIAGSFKAQKNKYVIIGISLIIFLIATIYMFTIPLPTGFSITSFLA